MCRPQVNDALMSDEMIFISTIRGKVCQMKH